MGVFSGSCHCGNIRVAFETALDPSAWTIRCCQCSFCRGHGAQTTTDPSGSLVIRATDPERMTRYRFGLKTADFIICADCGLYVAAVISNGKSFATLNVNTLRLTGLPDEKTAVSYDGESAEARRSRRRSRWTPTTVIS